MLTPLNRVGRVALLPLCGLGMLGLASVPARSQSLALNGSATATINQLGTATTGSATFGGGAGSATTSYFFVNAYNTSQVTVGRGANITNLNGFDASSITVTGGNITNLSPGAGGTGSGPLTVSGGNLGMVDARYTSSLSVSGGVFQSLMTSYSGSTISGGGFNFLTIKGNTILTGGDIAVIDVESPLNVFGTNLVLSNIPNNGSLLTGTLQDGEAIDARLTGTIQFLSLNNAPVPEASTTVSFGLMLALGVGGLVVAARRKSRGEKAGA